MKKPFAWKTPAVVTFTIFNFEKRSRFWAFKQMAIARPWLRHVPGLRFYKMLGAGRGLVFSLRPDWNRYALLAVWDNREQAENFLASSTFMRRYRLHAASLSTVIMRPVSAHGQWDKINPFWPVATNSAKDLKPLAVITRAAINWRRMPAFWQQAAPVSVELEKQPGLLASIGVGEAPFIRQATFSIWKSYQAMQDFAYKSAGHVHTIRLTRQDKWYREELFARFEILAAEGDFFHL